MLRTRGSALARYDTIESESESFVAAKEREEPPPVDTRPCNGRFKVVEDGETIAKRGHSQLPSRAAPVSTVALAAHIPLDREELRNESHDRRGRTRGKTGSFRMVNTTFYCYSEHWIIGTSETSSQLQHRHPRHISTRILLISYCSMTSETRVNISR